MKKLLIIHNKYRYIGGEDVAVNNEIEFLKEYFDVRVLFFSNNIEKIIKQSFSFIRNNNLESNKAIEKEIEDFKPNYVYIHNTWFKISLGLFKLLESKNIKTILKIHNFRYYCTRSYFTSSHLLKDQTCLACGQNKTNLGFFNKYFNESFFKSILINRYGKKYFKIIQNNNLNLLVLTDFHRIYLSDLGVDLDKINVFPNYLNNKKIQKKNNSQPYIFYAGRISIEKGIEELINSFLKANLRDITLKIAGEGPLLEKLKEKYQHSNINFLGEISNEESLSIMKLSLAVVTATKLYEGQPTLLCEASSLGIPSIFPKTGGVEEFFPDNCKLSFNQFDYEDLTIKLQHLQNKELLTQEGQKNKIYLNKYLNKNNLIEKFLEIINNDG
jgi:glycosyltransferase involved in cell wall biosynthesis